MKSMVNVSAKLITDIIENKASACCVKERLNSILNGKEYWEYNYILRFFYTLSYFFLDDENFGEISAFIKSKGIDCVFFEQGEKNYSRLYYIWLYCNGDDELKERLKEKIADSIIIFMNDYLYMLICMIVADKDLCRECFSRLNGKCSHDVIFYNDLFGYLFLYAVGNQKIQIVLNLVNVCKGVGLEYIVAMVVEHTDYFYNHLEMYHSKILPKQFLDEDGKALPLKEIIAVLFSDKFLIRNTSLNSKNVVGILCGLSKVIDVENLDKIKDYIPRIERINSYEAGLLLSTKGLNSIVSDIAGETVLLSDSEDFCVVENMSWIVDFGKVFKNSEVYFEVEDSLAYAKEKSMYKLLRDVSKSGIHVVLKNKNDIEKIKSIICNNSERVTKMAIRLGIINKENFEKMLELAVENKAVNAIKTMNSMYDYALSRDVCRVALKTDSGGRRSYFYTVKEN